MLAKHDWISTEKEYFGQANTAYDFNATDPKEAQRKLVKLEETKDKLSKNVNMRAMTMLGKAEEKVLSKKEESLFQTVIINLSFLIVRHL